MSKNKKYTKDDIDKFHDYELFEPDKTIFIGSHSYIDDEEAGVDYRMAETTIKNLHILDRDLHESGITILMNNIGGCVHHGLAIYDAIITCQNKVKIVVYGHAMSMGSLIFQAADERIMAPNARMMIHFGEVGLKGHNLNVLKQAEELKKVDHIINSIYLKRIKEVNPRFTMKKFEEASVFDWFLSPEEAIEKGLCDTIKQRQN